MTSSPTISHPNQVEDGFGYTCETIAFRGADGLRLVADRFVAVDEDVEQVVDDEPRSGGPGRRRKLVPVLFLHGGGQTRHSWRATAIRMALEGYCAITLDLRGHGDSDWAPDGDYETEAFARDLHEVVGQLDSPPVMVGASLGGLATMLAVGADGGPIVRACVFVDITPRMERTGVRRVLQFMSAFADGFGSLDEAHKAVQAYLPHRNSSSSPRKGLVKNLRRSRRDGRWRWHWDQRFLDGRVGNDAESGWDAKQRGYAEHLSQIKTPVCLIRGRMSDLVSEESVREFLDLVPHAKYVDVHAHHMVAGDSNDCFTSALLDFARDLEFTVPSTDGRVHLRSKL